MPRLFVAIDLPVSVREELVRVQPPPAPGLRRVSMEQIHLTLHFIGDAEIEPLVRALAAVVGSSLTIVIEGIGKFPPQGKASVLWAGVQRNSELCGLHAAIGKALETAGFPTETRPFSPHITLARCGHRVPAESVDEFLTRQKGLSLPPVAVSGFGLYSSTNVDGAPVYRRERWFPLSATVQDK